MKFGVLYGIGVGPGDPDLMTLKGARVLQGCRHVFVPKARSENGSIALAIAGRYLRADSLIHELVFPMSDDSGELSLHWAQAARSVADVVGMGEDACFLTLGDPLLYSTYIYLVRSLREQLPGLDVVTVPGITAFSAAAHPGKGALDEEGSEFFSADFGEDGEEIGCAAVGDPHFLAVENVMFAVGREVGASARGERGRSRRVAL